MNNISHVRANDETIAEQKNFFLNNNSSTYLLDKVPDVVLILNENRQIVFSNDNLLNLVGVDFANEIYGKRPGEVFNCIHSNENLLGCGSTEFCKQCGAFKAIINSINGKKDVQECRIIQNDTGLAFDLRVFSSPISIEGRSFILFSIVDISNEKRREVLERTFFHDIINTAVGIKSIMELLEMELPEEHSEYRNLIKASSTKLLEEINAQRQLIAAENSSLNLDYREISTKDIINEVVNLVKYYNISENIRINIDDNLEDVRIVTDKALMGRVITNLMKNAIEAEYPKGEVTIGCETENEKVHFWIKNITVMPKEVQLQLFQRSFSTKGFGRGIGTYSVKLLTEKYLGGHVDFSSNEEQGTIFNVYFPKNLLDKISEN
jgi:nitrogen-specific signal transduction histidine kinase